MTDSQHFAVFHKGEDINGGAEAVAWELQRTFAAPLYVGVRDPSIEPDNVGDVHELFDGRISTWAIHRGAPTREISYLANWLLSGTPLDALRSYDVVLGTGLETLLYCGPASQLHVHYIHHTGRMYTDLLHHWPDSLRGTFGRLYSAVMRLLLNDASNRPDLLVCNSELIAHRVKKYWGVSDDRIEVVYPPVPTESFSTNEESSGDFYLTVSRLERHKRIGDIVDTFARMPDRKLKIAGTGLEESDLQSRSKQNVEFLGYVSEQKKRTLLSQANAFIYNAEHEDFGIAPIEALASGTPVLGVREGMTQYQVIDGRNGYSFERSGSPSLLDVINRFEEEGVKWAESDIEDSAERYSVESFRAGMRAAIKKAMTAVDTTPDWYPSDEECAPNN